MKVCSDARDAFQMVLVWPAFFETSFSTCHQGAVNLSLFHNKLNSIHSADISNFIPNDMDQANSNSF